MLNTKGRYILRSKLLDAFEWMAYYRELKCTLGDHDTYPCTKETVERNFLEWWSAYCTLENLAGALCEYENVHKWLGITEKDKEVAKAKGIAEAKRYAVEDTEEISF